MTLLLSPRSGLINNLLDPSSVPNLLQVVDSSSLPFPAAAAGTGIHVNADGSISPRLRPRQPMICDWFLGGGLTTGTIGALGWGLAGFGTPAVARASGAAFSGTGVANRITLSSSAATGDRSCLLLADTETRTVMRPHDLDIMQLVFSVSASTTRRIFFGLSTNFATDPAAMINGIGVFFDSALSPNLQIISRAASVGSPVNTGVALTVGSAQLLTIRRNADDNYDFYLGTAASPQSTLLGSILAGVANTTSMGVGVRLESLAVASPSMSIGYFGLQAIGEGALASDDFLQG